MSTELSRLPYFQESLGKQKRTRKYALVTLYDCPLQFLGYLIFSFRVIHGSSKQICKRGEDLHRNGLFNFLAVIILYCDVLE
jgi:hypothetical protein